LTAATVLATIASAILLALMLAAPLLPQPATGSTPRSVAPTPSASTQPLLPLGLFLQRGPVSFGSGPCMAVELTPQSYPVATDAGTATVLWWDRGIFDPGNPETCASRAGDLHAVDAAVVAVHQDDAPTGRLIGYGVSFPITIEFAGPVNFNFTILLSRSTPDLIQAVVTNPQGTPGLVFDKVDVVDPPLASQSPAPSQAATASIGLYLLEGPFTTEGACLAVELTPDSYSVFPGALGVATIRWWERGGADLEDPTVCLSRIGDVHEVVASMAAVAGAEVPTYVVRFFAPLPGSDGSDAIEFSILADESDHDRLTALRNAPSGTERLIFYRVDSLDPPLVPAPSGSTAP
jgi:hypothetical protein